MLNTQIIKALEHFAHPSLQESWDNTGLQVGTLGQECTGALICVDVTPAVVEEAVALGYNLIISHHPLMFKGVKRLTGDTPQQVAAINAIAAGISIYSSHTAMDSTKGGVSYTLAKSIGVEPLKVLDPLSDRFVKLEVIVPQSHADIVRASLFDAGAGEFDGYDCCSFNTDGYGTFRAAEGSHPFVGEIGELHNENEVSISVLVPVHLINKVESTLLEVHPYERPAYWIIPLLNRMTAYGLGIYGIIEEGLKPLAFVDKVKKALGTETLRTTSLPDDDTTIRRVALCGGSGGEYIPRALAMGAQVYISADIKYHDFVDFDGRIFIIDAGHYETESAITSVMMDIIKKECPGFDAVKIASKGTNPVHYI